MIFPVLQIRMMKHAANAECGPGALAAAPRRVNRLTGQRFHGEPQFIRYAGEMLHQLKMIRILIILTDLRFAKARRVKT